MMWRWMNIIWKLCFYLVIKNLFARSWHLDLSILLKYCKKICFEREFECHLLIIQNSWLKYKCIVLPLPIWIGLAFARPVFEFLALKSVSPVSQTEVEFLLREMSHPVMLSPYRVSTSSWFWFVCSSGWFSNRTDDDGKRECYIVAVVVAVTAELYCTLHCTSQCRHHHQRENKKNVRDRHTSRFGDRRSMQPGGEEFGCCSYLRIVCVYEFWSVIVGMIVALACSSSSSCRRRW